MLVKDIEFQSAQHVVDEIRNMNVKGGSPFGRAAAWAYKLICKQEDLNSCEKLRERFDSVSNEMMTLKPTMATIFNTKDLVYTYLDQYGKEPAEELREKISGLCDRIIDHSEQSVEKLGVYGGNLIHDQDTVMMHSYSSTLMSVFTHAAGQGKKFRVICTESRPLRESRLAAKVLQSCGIPVTYITDASLWEFMPTADLIIMGADSIACDGSVANKMGTAMISQLAQSCKKPVYIASELYKLDTRTRYGYKIQLERRSEDEIVSSNDFESLDGIEIINQFFDMTPANQITGFITEEGIIAPQMVNICWAKVQEKLL